MSDLISRQALCEYALNQKDKSVTPNDIMRFPPAQPKKRTEERTETHACDCISRQAAIDAVNTALFPKINTAKDAERALRNLPSAQPTEASCWGCNCQKMERLKEQKTFSEMVHLHDAETHEERTETHGVCLDAIDRQVAIDALHDEIVRRRINEDLIDDGALDEFDTEAILRRLPPAQPELPEWAQKVEEYRKSAPSFVRNQLVWALYQTWKEYDGQLVHQRGKENR